MSLESLRTPAALLDLNRLERNCARMRDRAASLGVTLRPHVKTHKCVEIARIQSGGQSAALTVSTLAEARAMAAGGFEELLLAVPLDPARFPEILEMPARISVLIDQLPALRALEAACAHVKRSQGVWLELDCGLGRSGADPNAPETLSLAMALDRSPWIRFEGLLTHAGHSYGVPPEGVPAIASEEREVVLRCARAIEACGVAVPGRSVGSTPTVTRVDHLGGITEIRPGNYVFFDATQIALGSCALQEIAFTVLSTVIGLYPQRGALVLDVGAIALSKDPGPRHANPGYGILLDLQGRPIGGLQLDALTQEHGVVHLREGTSWPAGLKLGDRMRIVPNHSCLAAAAFDRYHLLRDDTLAGTWSTVRGW